MLINDILANIEIIAFVILILCLLFTITFRRLAQKVKTAPQKNKAEVEKYKKLFAHTARTQEAEISQTSKSLRKAYRKNWAERILGVKAYAEAREIIRNLIMTNTAFLSAVLVSFGLLLSGYSVLKQFGGPLADLKMVCLSTLLIYSLFMLILESRILNYIPILLWVDDEVIDEMQHIRKSDYVAELMDEAFDRFSDSLRAVFYAVVCIFWFFNTFAFIAAVLILTAIIIASDLDRKLRITIF